MNNAEAFDRLAEMIIAIAPSFGMLLLLLTLKLVCVLIPISWAIWMSDLFIRAGGWRGAAFVGLVWLLAFRVVAR